MLLVGLLLLQSLREGIHAAGPGGDYVSDAPYMYTRTQGSGDTSSVHPHLMLMSFAPDAKSSDGSAVITLASP